MEHSDRLLTVFSAELEARDGNAVLEVPERELVLGDLAVGDTYRIAVLPQPEVATDRPGNEPSPKEQEPPTSSGPPVEKGEVCEVEIEDTGEQGDGIARVGPGYIVIVPNTAIGDRVTVEITSARENFAFADVLEDESTPG